MPGSKGQRLFELVRANYRAKRKARAHRNGERATLGSRLADRHVGDPPESAIGIGVRESPEDQGTRTSGRWIPTVAALRRDLTASDFATRYLVVGIRTLVAKNEPKDVKRSTRWKTRSRSRQIAVNISAARSPICMPYNDTTPRNIWTDATP